MTRIHRAIAAWIAQTWGLGPVILRHGSLRARWAMLRMILVGIWTGGRR